MEVSYIFDVNSIDIFCKITSTYAPPPRSDQITSSLSSMPNMFPLPQLPHFSSGPFYVSSDCQSHAHRERYEKAKRIYCATPVGEKMQSLADSDCLPTSENVAVSTSLCRMIIIDKVPFFKRLLMDENLFLMLTQDLWLWKPDLWQFFKTVISICPCQHLYLYEKWNWILIFLAWTPILIHRIH